MREPVRINLGLQGGGAHGAFTWGVLDRLLEEPWLEIAAVTGTSAGALNGAALKSGWVRGDREGAREALEALWQQVSGISDLRMPAWMQGFVPEPFFTAKALEYSPLFAMADTLTRVVSPYIYGPFYKNPLERIVSEFDFDKVCTRVKGPELHVCTTCVRDGKVRVFTGEGINTDVILASACLPTLFQAIEMPDPVTGAPEAFWDGGYTGNPALFPLFEAHLPDDIVIVNINPLEREGIPATPQDIANRINEISFNSSLLRELRAIEFVQRLLDQGQIPEGAMKRLRVHMIADDGLMNDLSVATKLVALPSVIAQLKAAGQEAAEVFLSKHADDLGQRQSADLRDMFA
ncbi:patatin-like phospholipase family protein [Primorskyibacter sp. S187A]|uniref:patatin-like phospholipase family protein n=1 Tax=Primorskyibacter sp. S187A TaxID=3415130 RepID=UPI003C7DF414